MKQKNREIFGAGMNTPFLNAAGDTYSATPFRFDLNSAPPPTTVPYFLAPPTEGDAVPDNAMEQVNSFQYQFDKFRAAISPEATTVTDSTSGINNKTGAGSKVNINNKQNPAAPVSGTFKTVGIIGVSVALIIIGVLVVRHHNSKNKKK